MKIFYGMITYHLYTVKDLRNWLMTNQDNGITDRMITRTRAWALVNNPYAQDSDVAISAVRDNEVVIGYTAIFAEHLAKPFQDQLFYWGSTQWIEPEYRGKGISAQMMLQLKNAINHRYLGLDSSIASCKLDQKQGYSIQYYNRYFFQWERKSRGIKSLIKQIYVQYCNNRVCKSLKKYAYSNRYITFIDDLTYEFIKTHSQQDLFLRKQKTFTWILQYPFWCEVGNDVNVATENCMFDSYVRRLRISAVQVYVKNVLCGVYIYSIVDGVYKLLYVYTDDNNIKQVYASITQTAIQNNVTKFCTMNKSLYDFMESVGVKGMYSKNYIESISLTLPPELKVDTNMHVQGGDGDMFC